MQVTDKINVLLEHIVTTRVQRYLAAHAHVIETAQFHPLFLLVKSISIN